MKVINIVAVYYRSFPLSKIAKIYAKTVYLVHP